MPRVRGAPDGGKRHLIRWTVEKDQVLLLTIHYVCGKYGVKIPFEIIAALLPGGASEGAILQHLSKLRQRLQALGLPVPPPIPRGGGHRNPTSSASRSEGASSKTLTRAKKSGHQDDETPVYDADWEKDPDGDYGEKPSRKLAPTKENAEQVQIKFEDQSAESDEPDDEYDPNTPLSQRGKIAKGTKFLALSREDYEETYAETSRDRRQHGGKTLPEPPEPTYVWKVGYGNKPGLEDYIKRIANDDVPDLDLNVGRDDTPRNRSVDFGHFDGSNGSFPLDNIHAGVLERPSLLVHDYTDIGDYHIESGTGYDPYPSPHVLPGPIPDPYMKNGLLSTHVPDCELMSFTGLPSCPEHYPTQATPWQNTVPTYPQPYDYLGHYQPQTNMPQVPSSTLVLSPTVELENELL